jgi:valyl-tRNA synthetase
VFVARDEAEAAAKAAAAGYTGALRRDDDVLETWFSSGLWSHSTLGWPNPQRQAELGFDRYLPSSVLVTGFDIIFFWVARMIMLTDHFTGEVPFKDVYFTGLIRDKDGQKMSKSKGNVLDPLDIVDGISLDDLLAKRTRGLMQPKMAEKIEKSTRKEFGDGIPAFGADALRFTFASLATHGRDIKFDLERAGGYKAFINKLWNASRFVLMNLGEDAHIAPVKPTTEAERWILTRLRDTLASVKEQLAAYRFDLAAQALYEFTWNDFCDWFLELSKPALNGSDAAAIASTRYTLAHVLETLLRALHPMIPFVTEEIWQHVRPLLGIEGETIMLRPYPEAADIEGDDAATAEVEWVKDVLTGVRRIRAEMNISPGKVIPLLFADGDATDRARATKFAAQVAFLGRVETPVWVDGEEPAAAVAVVGGMRALIPLEGLIDVGAEKARLAKEIARIEGEVRKCEGKLGNANFVANAPAEVVEQERQRIADWTRQADAMREQAKKLGA